MPVVPQTTPQALTRGNLRSLRRLAAQATAEARWLKVFGITALVAGALFLAAQRHFLPEVQGLLPVMVTVLGGGGLLLGGALHWRRQRLWLPLQAAMAAGHKQVWRGRLSEVQALGNGRLRYVIDDEAMDLLPLAGPLEPHPLPQGAAVRDLQVLCDRDVALHWIARGADKLLLEVQGTGEAPATHARRETAADDLHQAHRQARLVLGFFAALVPVIAGVVAAPTGFEARTLGTALGVGTAAWLLMAGIARLLARQRRRQATQMHTITGVLSERFRTVSRLGNQPPQSWLWYRVGGHLVQVDTPVESVKLGELLTLSYLVRTDAPDAGGLLTTVKRAEPEAA